MTKKTEIRSVRPGEVRAEQGLKLAGIAAPTGVIAHIGNFDECIGPSAFTRALREKQIVVCTREHDPVRGILGSTKSGTLSLSQEPDGSLGFLCQLDSRQQSHRDLHFSVGRGDLSSMSFAFSVHGDSGEEWRSQGQGKPPLRTLKDVDLHDIAIVVAPAYPTGTSVSVRSVDYTATTRTLAAPSLVQLRAAMQKQKEEIFRTWPKEWGFAEVKDEHGNTIDFRCVTAEERDQINRARVRILGAQIAEEQRAEECACDCPECARGNCAECSDEECTDENCDHEEKVQ